jgi:hypothetical protein
MTLKSNIKDCFTTSVSLKNIIIPLRNSLPLPSTQTTSIITPTLADPPLSAETQLPTSLIIKRQEERRNSQTKALVLSARILLKDSNFPRLISTSMTHLMTKGA